MNPIPPLEQMYPNRCFDCLKPIPHSEIVCEDCKPKGD